MTRSGSGRQSSHSLHLYILQATYTHCEVPELLSHRQSRPSEIELADIAVSGEFVLSRTDTEAWVNRYPHRTVPGVQRIKKKKKKVKKKKTAEAVPDPGPT